MCICPLLFIIISITSRYIGDVATDLHVPLF